LLDDLDDDDEEEEDGTGGIIRDDEFGVANGGRRCGE
jgi:hypothetical protein